MSYVGSRPEQSTTSEAALLTALFNLATTPANQAIAKNSDGTFSNVSVSGGSSGITINSTAITGGTTGRILYDNAGTVGELATTGSGSVVLATSPTLTTPVLGVATATSLAIGGATLGSNGLAVSGHLLLEGVTSTGATGTGNLVFGTSPTLSNPVVGTQSASDNSTKGASTAYVTSAISTAIAGVNPAVAVTVATTQASDTSSLTYNNGVSGIGATLTGSNNTALTFDGVTLTSLGQRVLVKNDTQSPSGAFNGVYYLTQLQTAILPPILTRALDYDMPSDINSTGAIPVVSGTANASTSWLLTSSVTTVGTDPLTYVRFSINPTTIQTTALTSAHIWVGNVSNLAVDVAVSGDLTLANTGAFTVAKIAGVAVGTPTGTTNVVFSNSPVLVTPTLGVASATSIATSAASPLLLTNGQLVTIALTSQTVGGATLTIPNFASVSDTFVFITLAQTLSNKTFVAPALGTPASGVGTNITGITAAHVVAGTFGTGAYTMDTSLTVPQIFTTSNAVTATSNAATITRANRINTVTNNSAAGLTITLSTTSALDGDMIMIRSLPSSAVAQTITWVNTENSDVTPSANLNASTTSPRTDGFQYNSGTSKWRCIASS